MANFHTETLNSHKFTLNDHCGFGRKRRFQFVICLLSAIHAYRHRL